MTLTKAEVAKRYRKRHPERVIEQRKKYKSNPEYKKWEKEYYIKNKKRILQKSWENKLKNRYGLTLDKYNEMMITQDNKCIICKKESNRLSIDHCHKTGEIRALLCMNCNAGLGTFNDNIVYLENAINYLKRFTRPSTD